MTLTQHLCVLPMCRLNLSICMSSTCLIIDRPDSCIIDLGVINENSPDPYSHLTALGGEHIENLMNERPIFLVVIQQMNLTLHNPYY